MLALPLLRGEQINVSVALTRHLQRQCGDSGLEAITTDVNNYNELRQLMIAATEASDHNLQILHRFHFHLEMVVSRLSRFQDELRLNFVWFDCFQQTRRITTNSFAVDWACGLWNLGAMLSQLGARTDRSTEERIRTANNYFTQAAGVFELIRNTILPQANIAVVSALTDNGLQMAIQLMLSQAHFCCYEKAARENKVGAGPLAKLATQTGVFYDAVKSLCQRAPLPSVLDNSWASTADFQGKSFRAVGEYWQSQVSKDQALSRGSGYGEEIARLYLAERLLREAMEIAARNRLSSMLTSAAESLLGNVVQNRTKAEKDNRAIYMETIPAESSLRDIGVMPVARPAPLGEYAGIEKPLFLEIYPDSVRRIRASHLQAIESILLEASEKSLAATGEYRSEINALGLPNSLEDYKFGGKLPDAVWVKIERVQAMGGISGLGTKFDEVQAAADCVSQSLLSIDQSLQREENQDEVFRKSHPNCPSQPSKVLNRSIRANLERMRGAVDSARANDGSIAEALRSESFIQFCNLRREEIEMSLPKKPQSNAEVGETNAPLPVNARALETLLTQIRALIEWREGIVAALEACSKEDITEELLACLYDADCNAVCARHLDRVQEKMSLLWDNIHCQPALLEKIKAANLQFITALQSDRVNVERKQMIQNLNGDADNYFSLHDQVNSGIAFYSGLQSELSALQQSSDELSRSQLLRRQEYETEHAGEQLHRTERAGDVKFGSNGRLWIAVTLAVAAVASVAYFKNMPGR